MTEEASPVALMREDVKQIATAAANEAVDRRNLTDRDQVKKILYSCLGAGRGLISESDPDGIIIAIDEATMSEIRGGHSPRTATVEECLKGQSADSFVTPSGLQAALDATVENDEVDIKSIVRGMLVPGGGTSFSFLDSGSLKINTPLESVTPQEVRAITREEIDKMPKGGGGSEMPTIRYNQTRGRLEVLRDLKWTAFDLTLDGQVATWIDRPAPMTEESVAVVDEKPRCQDAWDSGFWWGVGSAFVGMLVGLALGILLS